MNRNSELVYVAAWVMSLNEENDPSLGNSWDPPLEMEQFGFLVGEWDGKGYMSSSDGIVEHECLVRWSARQMLDGWAIQDEISVASSRGIPISSSTMLRTYSADLGQWKVVEMRFPDQRITEFRAHRVGNSMVMLSQERDDSAIQRIRFVYYDIYSDSFKVRMETSANGGVWTHAGLRLVLKRK